MILDGRNETRRPRKNWDTLSIRGRLLGGVTARLRNPKEPNPWEKTRLALSGCSVSKLHVERMR